MSNRPTILFIAFCVFSAFSNAQEAKVRVKVENEGSVWVGQEVSLSVTVLAPGYFDSAVNFDLPDPSGVLLMPPTDHPVVGSEIIDDVRYVTQWHELRAWPMQAGEQTIPAITIRFAYKNSPLAQNAQQTSVTTDPITMKVDSPPGTEGMGTVISARQFTVDEEWKPAIDSGDIKSGDAFTRTITFSAHDMPGMIFPPFPTGDIDGLGVYSKQHVDDENDSRGSLLGKRQDVITYVAKQPGQFTIPAAQFSWFDLDTKRLRTQQFVAHTFTVIANPALASGVNTDAMKAQTDDERFFQDWRFLIVFVLLALVFLYLGFSRSVRQKLWRVVQPLWPVHLQTLNPTNQFLR